MLKFEVRGGAIPQGSKIRTKHGMREAAAGLKAWRSSIVTAAQWAASLEAPPPSFRFPPMDGPLMITFTAFLPKPKGTRFRDYPAGPPDLDKLQRAVGDSLKIAGVITDDARIVQWIAGKRWAPVEPFIAVRIDTFPPTGKTP